MTVEIDDTAWGIPVAGVWLGFHRVETGEIFVKEVSVEHFKKGAFGRKDYLDAALTVAKHTLFDDLNITKDEQIHICSGYVLSSIYEWLYNRNFNIKRKKIVGRLQDVMESTSRDYINSLPNFSKKPSEPLYNALIHWIEEDPEHRMQYVKTGWKKIRNML